MKHYLGIDIGTFESKGVLVDATGQIVAQRRSGPQDAGAAARLRGASRRARIGGATSTASDASTCCAERRRAGRIARHRRERHRPVHAARRRRRRAADERRALWRRHARRTGDRAISPSAIGDETHPRALRQRADLAIGRAQDPVAAAQHAPRSSPAPRKILSSTSFLVHRLTGRVRHRPLLAPRTPARSIASTGWPGATSSPTTSSISIALPRSRLDDRHRRRASPTRPPRRPALPPGTPGDRRHHRCGRRGRSASGSSEPGDMMLMYGSTMFMIMLITAERVGIRACGMRHGCFPASMPRCPALRRAAR